MAAAKGGTEALNRVLNNYEQAAAETHTSANGDTWYLCRGVEGNIFVAHEPNALSGGKPSQTDLGTFLAKGNHGPEHQSLRQLIGRLIDVHD
jgi:hypothetical protein